MTDKSSSLDYWLLPLLLLMLIAYAAPWVVTQSAGTTVGGYDFAEWTSLHPVARESSPALLVTLMLRFPLACIGLMAAVGTPHNSTMLRRMLYAGIALATTIASLPPIEFFTVARDDFNYQQQFMLAAVVFVGILIGWSGKLARFRGWLLAALSLLGTGASILGLNQGYSLMSAFVLSLGIGAGGIALTVLFALCLLYIVVNAAAKPLRR